jgi:homoserine dehydrogenase
VAAGRDRCEELGIGLLGCGVVGSAVARALARHAGLIGCRAGRRPVIRAVAVRSPGRRRDVPVAPAVFCSDAWQVATRPDVDVVVEVIGGLQVAGGAVEAALDAGKHVVTANKELVARRFGKLADLAAASGRRLLFEAAVMAGTPAVSTVRSLAGDRISRLQGVLNGTSNFCLQKMQAGLPLAGAVAEAQARGYAERDPSADIEGHDAAAKLAILAALAFGRASLDEVTVTGITGLEPADVAAAAGRGQAVRLVAEARAEGGRICAGVAPVFLDASHPLAGVRGHHNGLLVDADLAGQLFIQGPGAGGDATASAILTDIIRAARPYASR